jgi:lipopolysaccharide transport system permease protein
LPARFYRKPSARVEDTFVTLTLGRPRHRTDLVRELVARDLKLRYRRSVLGIAWSQLAPLSMVAVLSFVFGHIIRLHVHHYTAFLVSGMMPWAWFQSAMIGGTASVVNGRDLVRQPGFPVPMLPVVSVASTMVNFALSLPVMFLFIGISFHSIPPTAIALPIVAAVQFLVILGPCYFLSAVDVRFRDVGHIVEIALLPLFYATPIFYSEPARYRILFLLNPMAHVMNAYHAILVNDSWPSFNGLAAVSLVACGVLVAGYRVFDRLSAHFPEEI